MTMDARELIDGYLDETLTADQQSALGDWLKAGADHRRQFAVALLLHDRLRNELMTATEVPAIEQTVRRSRLHMPSVRSVSALLATAGVLLLGVFLAWQQLGQATVSAADRELDRIIDVSAALLVRTFEITVEEAAVPSPQGSRPKLLEDSRPPKPPLDKAVLHVRGGKQFVLTRTTRDGLPFVTGSNGQTSWAVRPDGPVRVSSDLNRFNRDLPGHEHSMPLNNLHDGLERLREAYEVQLLPLEGQEAANLDDSSCRLLVAEKKRGFRGPNRVEILYDADSGRIQQMRFVEMPYGPEQITLRMTLVNEQPLIEKFFEHEAHHAPDRTIEYED